MGKKVEPEDIDFVRLARLLKAVAHPVRLKIIYELSKNKRVCVTDLASRLNVRQPSISQNLNILRNAGIIDCDREGNKTLCYLRVDCLKYLVGLCQEAEYEKR